jgi:hypothetical protein
MTIGVCGGCGGELDDHALTLELTVSPGPRGESAWSVTQTRIRAWALCRTCQASPASATLRRMIADPWAASIAPGPLNRCELRCAQPPRRRIRMLMGRLRPDRETVCPVCFGACDVVDAGPAAPPHARRLRLRRRTVAPAWRPGGGDEAGPGMGWGPLNPDTEPAGES